MLTGETARLLREYLDKNWSGQKVVAKIIHRAVREFVDRELARGG